jgi:hypothetical protein
MEAAIYGLKSNGPASLPSSGPTHLFRFEEDGSGFADLGQLGDGQMDYDGLAQSATHGLMAFCLSANGSALVSIDPDTGMTFIRGVLLEGREIRGAAFDALDTLWAVDGRKGGDNLGSSRVYEESKGSQASRARPGKYRRR